MIIYDTDWLYVFKINANIKNIYKIIERIDIEKFTIILNKSKRIDLRKYNYKINQNKIIITINKKKIKELVDTLINENIKFILSEETEEKAKYIPSCIGKGKVNFYTKVYPKKSIIDFVANTSIYGPQVLMDNPEESAEQFYKHSNTIIPILIIIALACLRLLIA